MRCSPCLTKFLLSILPINVSGIGINFQYQNLNGSATYSDQRDNKKLKFYSLIEKLAEPFLNFILASIAKQTKMLSRSSSVKAGDKSILSYGEGDNADRLILCRYYCLFCNRGEYSAKGLWKGLSPISYEIILLYSA